MPTAALLNGLIETSINKLVSFDPNGTSKLAALADYRLTLYLQGTPVQLTLVFSPHHIDVLSEMVSFDTLITDLPVNHCVIKTSLEVLPQLRDSSQLTSLIKQDKLVVEGELAVAQKVSDLLQNLDIDWEDEVAKKTSDVFAHQTFRVAKQALETGKATFGRLQKMVVNGMIEEKPVAAHRLAVMHFNDQVSELRDDVARFEARISQLENEK